MTARKPPLDTEAQDALRLCTLPLVEPEPTEPTDATPAPEDEGKETNGKDLEP